MNLSVLLPSAENVRSLWDHQLGYLFANWFNTLTVSAAASLAALAATLVFSFTLSRWPLLKRPLGPFLAASQSFPLQAIAPLIIIVIGTGFLTKFMIATLIAFFPMFASYSASLETVPLRFIKYSQLCGASPWQIIFFVRFRHSLPQLVSSTKVGFTLATLGAVVAEFIQPDSGIGRVLLIAQSDFNATLIYACIFLLLIQGVTVFTTLQFIEDRVAARRAINA